MQPCCLTFAHNTGSVAFLWKTRPQETVEKNEVDINWWQAGPDVST